MTENKVLNEYLKLLNYEEIPSFLIKYFECKSLKRLKKIGYFCGMDYASKDIYDFLEYISRFDHSLTTALLTWHCSKDRQATIAALFHDISTPCFSHTIDYMNKDYVKQESTEVNIENVLKKDKYLINCLKCDNITTSDIVNFKKYSIVDLNRPMLCADRLDGIILNSLFWTKKMTICEAKKIIDSIQVFENENKLLEIGFIDKEVIDILLKHNKLVDLYCHSKEDNYMMELLASITRIGIENKCFSYEDLYILNEEEVIDLILNSNDSYLLSKWHLFQNIKKENIPQIELPLVKKRIIKPLINGNRTD